MVNTLYKRDLSQKSYFEPTIFTSGVFGAADLNGSEHLISRLLVGQGWKTQKGQEARYGLLGLPRAFIVVDSII